MRRLARHLSCALGAALLFGLCAPARAGEASFETDLFHPTDTANGYFSVDGAFPVRHLGFTAGLFGTWAHQPLVLRDPMGNVPPGGEVIGDQIGMDLVGSFGLFDRLELGIDLPFIPYQSTDDSLVGLPGGIHATGLGDLRLDLKVLIYPVELKGGNRIGLSLVAGLRIPTGDSTSFLGQDGVSGYPRLVAEWKNHRAGIAINFGAILRSTRSFDDLYISHQLAYGVAGQVGIFGGLSAIGELTGLVGVGLPADRSGLLASEAPLEFALGGRYHWPIGFEVSLAGGTGLTRGYGSPDGRIFLGVRYQSPARAPAPNKIAPPHPIAKPHPVAAHPITPPPIAAHPLAPPDADHDGIPDARDRCPKLAGVQENDGCPDVDSDGDGLVDRLDKCPFDVEIYNGNQDDDGCPDAGPELARIGDTQIVIEQPILFGKGARLEPRSLKVIGVVARLLTLHPEITRVRVEGHTDNRGSALDNLDLSRARAAAVRRVLVEDDHIDGKRLTAVGYGPDKPIADNRTEAGRAKNRRIEFTIVARTPPKAP
ncbi:MAG TPA: OmpA family protein [Polyangia bacterium]